MTILTDDECREIYNTAMAMPERSVVQTMRVIEAAVIAKLSAKLQIVTVERALEMAELAGIEHINHIKYRGRFNKCTVPEKHEMRCLTDLVNIASKAAYAAGEAAQRGAWSAAIAWVVRERNSASPMQSFENSLTAAQETKARWANDGYESDIVELCERVNAEQSE